VWLDGVTEPMDEPFLWPLFAVLLSRITRGCFVGHLGGRDDTRRENDLVSDAVLVTTVFTCRA